MTSFGGPEEHDASAPDAAETAKFVTGSTMGHVMVMTFTGAVGLMAIFFVDLVDMYFLSLLGTAEVAGAIGFAGAIVFTNLSFAIGLAIASAALVARSLGAGKAEKAIEYSSNSLLFSLVFGVVVAVLLAIGASSILDLLGAAGAAKALALDYLVIVIPSFPLLCIGLCLSGVLRALGDAKRAMYLTLSAALTNALLDPIFIFSLEMGVQGAAAASAVARVVMLAFGIYAVVRVHKFVRLPTLEGFHRDLPDILKIVVPAMLTQIATPIGNAYITSAMAPSGTDAVAALAIVTRLVPVAFGIVFSLSGAIGPIVGQNFGANRHDRVLRTYFDALKFCTIYVVLTSVLLFFLREEIALAFNASGDAAALIAFFCAVIGPTWLFSGFQYVANASFNNLGKPHYSTLFNWTKTVIGIVPLVTAGAWFAGAEGVLAGMGAANTIFGLAAVVYGYRLIKQTERRGTA